jgi:hypothetical protein
MIKGFFNKITIIKNALIWKHKTATVKYVEFIIGLLETQSERDQESFKKNLKKGRFENMDKKIKGALILGDDGGLYLLLNYAAEKSLEEEIILVSRVPKEFLNEKRNKDNKIILGKGAFGSVGLALSIFGDEKVDICQLVCVKKYKMSKEKGKEKGLNDITSSVFEDYLAKKLNDSIYAPVALDMAITTNELIDEKHRESYLFMEIVPQNTADKVFEKKENQKWKFQKPYCLAVMKTMKELLEKDRILNTDLKPQNTLFETSSRRMAIIDLGSSIYIGKNLELEKFDASYAGFGWTKPYCPPELIDVKDEKKDIINTKKAISYLCGATIAEVTTELERNKKIAIMNEWSLGKKSDLLGNKTDLNTKGFLLRIL